MEPLSERLARWKAILKLQYGVIAIVICKYNVFGAHKCVHFGKVCLKYQHSVHNIEFWVCYCILCMENYGVIKLFIWCVGNIEPIYKCFSAVESVFFLFWTQNASKLESGRRTKALWNECERVSWVRSKEREKCWPFKTLVRRFVFNGILISNYRHNCCVQIVESHTRVPTMPSCWG